MKLGRHLCARVAFCFLAALGVGTRSGADEYFHESFSSSPFDPAAPRWCERYHHGHFADGAVRFHRSAASPDECASGRAERSSLSCATAGCEPCGSGVGSPCAKVGDPWGNAVIMTTADHVGTRRSVAARFEIERQLPVGEAHLGLYAALHPHCHMTVQAMLVPDRPAVYHLNLAAINEEIGGDAEVYRECRRNVVHAISPPLAAGIKLDEGEVYFWTLRVHLDSRQDIVASTSIGDIGGRVLASSRHVFTGAPAAAAWLGVAGQAARYAFGAQLSLAPSPSGGEPSVLLLDFAGRAR